MTPEFLTIEDVLDIHADQIQRYGGDAGVRDMGLLLSALAIPPSTFDGAFLHGTLSDMAAAFLFHIVQNHPFVDGNKRVGTVSAIVFLDLNGVNVEVDEDVLASLVLSVAQGTTDKGKIAKFLRDHSWS